MNRTAVLLILAALLPYNLYSATPADPSDYVLVSYKLTAAQEAEFSAEDKVISPFWDNWGSVTRNLDYAHLRPATHGWNRSIEGFTGDNDAQMLARAAYGEKGIYFLFEVIDDQFCDICINCIGTTCDADPSWMNDAVDIFIDQVGTAVQTALKETFFINYAYDRKTKTMAQIQCRFGNEEAVTEFRFNRFDLATNQMVYQKYLLTYAKENFGILLESVKISDNTKKQEWFIPWNQVGKEGGIQPQTEGKKIALVLGYNDADGGADQYDALRWKNRADPTLRVRPDSATACTPVPGGGYTSPCNWAHVPTESWGDLEFGPVLENISVKIPMRAGILPSEIVKTEYFTMAGKRIADRNGRMDIADNALIIERALTIDGRNVTNRCVIANGQVANRLPSVK